MEAVPRKPIAALANCSDCNLPAPCLAIEAAVPIALDKAYGNKL